MHLSRCRCTWCRPLLVLLLLLVVGITCDTVCTVLPLLADPVDLPRLLLPLPPLLCSCTLLLGWRQAVSQATAGIHGVWPRVHWMTEVEHRDVKVLTRIAEHLNSRAGSTHTVWGEHEGRVVGC